MSRDRTDEIFQAAYAELHQMADALRLHDSVVAVQPTSLVHEAWLRLADGVDFDSERHLKAIVARAMRQILVDRSRRQGARKRGGGWQRVTLSGLGDDSLVVEALALVQGLDGLQELNPTHAAVVELRVLGGMNNREIASTLQISERSVGRAWRTARARLMAQLSTSSA